MQALLFSSNPDEIAILTSLLQQAGMLVRTIHSLEGLPESLADRPTEFIFLCFPYGNEKRLNLITQIRSFTEVPILVLTDSLPESRQIAIYEAGADLVVSRSIGMLLLLSQVKALMRRGNAGVLYTSLPTLSQGDVVLDPGTRSVQVGEHSPKRLTQLEFRLLYVLITNAGRIHSAESLVEQVWGYNGEGNRELVRGLVQRLRGKVENDPRNPKYILTEPGVGYYFVRLPELS
jgi:two-component system KDP operon response regulator KdpE